jgi:8-oxo-dGTP pyrophosphatase MutT (NUDIX family)
MLSLDAARAPTPPRDAATVLCLRTSAEAGIEVFCVQRHARSPFMGGAVVFPGGKLDAADADPAWREAGSAALANGVQPRALAFAADAAHAAALAVCACREALEEAGLLPTAPPLGAREAEGLRARLRAGEPLAPLLRDVGAALDTRSLVPFARWITPAAETRRYDARFFLTRLPPGQVGRHDGHETTHGLWATPARWLAAFAAGELFLAPPTSRSLEILGAAGSIEEALELAAEQSLEPICPTFVPGDPPMLTLPGDPLHEVAERRVAGPTRFVLRAGRFVGEDPPPNA